MIHVDTGFLISALRRGSIEDRRLRRWLSEGDCGGEGKGTAMIVRWKSWQCWFRAFPPPPNFCFQPTGYAGG
jgi:hypothetical protein